MKLKLLFRLISLTIFFTLVSFSVGAQTCLSYTFSSPGAPSSCTYTYSGSGWDIVPPSSIPSDESICILADITINFNDIDGSIYVAPGVTFSGQIDSFETAIVDGTLDLSNSPSIAGGNTLYVSDTGTVNFTGDTTITGPSIIHNNGNLNINGNLSLTGSSSIVVYEDGHFVVQGNASLTGSNGISNCGLFEVVTGTLSGSGDPALQNECSAYINNDFVLSGDTTNNGTLIVNGTIDLNGNDLYNNDLVLVDHIIVDGDNIIGNDTSSVLIVRNNAELINNATITDHFYFDMDDGGGFDTVCGSCIEDITILVDVTVPSDQDLLKADCGSNIIPDFSGTPGMLDFDGIDDYAEIITSPIDGVHEFTISLWLKYDGTLLTGFQEAFVLGQKDFFNIYLSKWTDSEPQYQSLKAEIYKDGGTLANALGFKFNPENWTNFTATVDYDSGTGTTTLQIFRNGHPGTVMNISNSVNTNSNPFRIGIINGSSTFLNYEGWIDEIKIFDKILTPDQIQQMVYQEIKNEAGNVRGNLIDKDIKDLSTNETIPWSNLISYFPMSTISGSELKDVSNSANHADLYNITTLQPQTAPMPFETVSDGPWTTEGTWLHGDVWDIEDLDADFASSQSPEPWSIVHIHDNVSTSESREALGMFIDVNKTLSVSGDNSITNNWYLQLDGTLDLADDSQLVQTMNSDLVTSANGKVLRRQEGNANYLWYNYWASPVGELGSTTLLDNNGTINNPNNSHFNVSMLKDGSGTPIEFTSDFQETGKISTRWLHNFTNGVTYYDWMNIDENTNINPGVGYTQKGTGNAGTEQQYIFEGKPNNGTILVNAIDTGGPGSVEGSSLTTTLVGNPYPSALDARQFITDNAGVIGGTILLWEQWAGNSHYLSQYEGGYGFINGLTTVRAYQYPGIPIAGQTQTEGIKVPTFYLPVAQGFFVEVVNDGDIEFNNGQRVFKQEDLGESVFYRSSDSNAQASTEEANNETQILRLEFGVSSGASRSFVLGFTPDATDGYDYGLDGGLVTNPPEDDMGSLLNGEQYVIQAFAPYTPDKEINLVLHASGNFTYNLRSTEITNFPENQDLFLVDNLTEQSYDLRSTEPYDFTSTAGSFTDRFKVVFQDPSLLSNQTFVEDNTLFYVNQDEDKLYIKQLKQQAKKVTLTNMLGQVVKAYDNINNQNLENGLNIAELNSGVYIMSVIEETNFKMDRKIVVD